MENWLKRLINIGFHAIELKPQRRKPTFNKLIQRGVSYTTAIHYLEPFWAYDYEKYGVLYDDKKTQVKLDDVLKDYAKLYFIYTVQSSLILSNYSIRTDFRCAYQGNFPQWDLDFFNKEAKNIEHLSRYSHILDQDMLRLGKKLRKNNEYSKVLEFGVIVMTEVGKERGNQFKSQEIKDTIRNLKETIGQLEKAKQDPELKRAELVALTNKATQLNDKFNETLKLIRHRSTIMGFPFVRVLMDEQRPESLGQDARDLCEIIHIRDKSETRLAMPLFFMAELLLSFIFPRFEGTYDEYRFARGDNTLLMFILKKMGAGMYRYYSRVYNRFGYHIRYLAVEDPATGEIVKETPYYLSTKKIYSQRFSTDAYADIFAQRLNKVKLGLNDVPEYSTVKASETELMTQNSYFIDEITKYKGDREE